MKEKGFTLIELLAVIVILGIIMSLAIPEIMSYINKSKRDSLYVSALHFIDGVNQYNDSNLINDRVFGSFNIVNGKIVEENPFSFNKKFSFDGTFTISEEGIELSFHDSSNNCVAKKNTSSRIIQGIFNNNICGNPDEDMFIFDEKTGTILAYKSVEYTINKDACINYFKKSNFSIVQLEKLCNNEIIEVEVKPVEKSGNIKLGTIISPFGLKKVHILSANADYLYEDGVINITKENDVSKIVIPKTIYGVDVKYISPESFSSGNFTNLDFKKEDGYRCVKELILPEGLLGIGERAFSENQIEELIIPSTVVYIDDYAFKYNSISNLNIKSKYLQFGHSPFSNNKLVGNDAFIYGRNINGTIDKKTLNSYAGSAKFDDDYNPLNLDITVDPEVKYIENYAFSGLGITSISLPEGLLEVGDYSFDQNSIQKLIIPSTVKEIGSHAFAFNSIDELVLPDGISSIDTYAFAYNNITTINIPSSIEVIAESAFENNNLTEVNFSEGLKNIGYRSFYGNEIQNLVIPSSVNTISQRAFYNNELQTVTFKPNSSMLMDAIGGYAFYKFSSSNPSLTKIIYDGVNNQNWVDAINGNYGTRFNTGTVINANGNVEIVSN